MSDTLLGDAPPVETVAPAADAGATAPIVETPPAEAPAAETGKPAELAEISHRICPRRMIRHRVSPSAPMAARPSCSRFNVTARRAGLSAPGTSSTSRV